MQIYTLPSNDSGLWQLGFHISVKNMAFKTLSKTAGTSDSLQVLQVKRFELLRQFCPGAGGRPRPGGNWKADQERHLLATAKFGFVLQRCLPGWWSLSRELVLASHGSTSFAWLPTELRPGSRRTRPVSLRAPWKRLCGER